MKSKVVLLYSGLFAVIIFASFEAFSLSGWRIAYERQPHLRCLPIEFTLMQERILKPHEIKIGTLVVFNPVEFSEFYIKDVKILKLVVGIPGDVVSMRAGNIYVNGDFIGTYKKKSMFQKYDPFMSDLEITLLDNQYWLSGSSSISVDSRYIGPVGIQNIIGKGYAII